MHDTFSVCGIERIGNLYSKLQDLFDRQWLASQALLQGNSVEQFHNHERLIFVFLDGVDGADIWMVDQRRGARFALEALQRSAVAGKLFRYELDRNRAMQPEVFRLVN